MSIDFLEFKVMYLNHTISLRVFKVKIISHAEIKAKNKSKYNMHIPGWLKRF